MDIDIVLALYRAGDDLLSHKYMTVIIVQTGGNRFKHTIIQETAWTLLFKVANVIAVVLTSVVKLSSTDEFLQIVYDTYVNLYTRDRVEVTFSLL